MNNTNYVLIFVLILTVSVAVLLTGLREATKAGAERNEAIFNKRAVLLAVEDQLGTKVDKLSDDEVEEVFSSQVDQKVLDANGQEIDGIMAEDVDMAKERKKADSERKYPLFVFNTDAGEEYYIVSVRGNGLWDEIWGNIALKNDLNTIVGAAFDHKGETPGLGAEIKDNPSFRKQFKDKKLYDAEGNYKAISAVKGGVKVPDHQIDVISGATVTTVGVEEMIQRGIKLYVPYFEKLKGDTSPTTGMLIKK